MNIYRFNILFGIALQLLIVVSVKHVAKHTTRSFFTVFDHINDLINLLGLFQLLARISANCLTTTGFSLIAADLIAARIEPSASNKWSRVCFDSVIGNRC